MGGGQLLACAGHRLNGRRFRRAHAITAFDLHELRAASGHVEVLP